MNLDSKVTSAVPSQYRWLLGCRKCQQTSLSSNVDLRKVNTQYQENDNTACYKVQNKPFCPQTRHSFRGREDALSWQKSMYQLFWSCQTGIWRREPKWVQTCSWSSSWRGMLQCLVSPLPPAPHSPDSTLGSQNSIFHLFRAGDVWEDQGSCASVGLLPTLFHTSQASKGNTPERGRMVTCCMHPSQKWHLICQTSEDEQIYQVYYIAGMKQQLCLGTCF